MQKSKSATIFIILSIFCFGMLSNFKLIYEINTIYWYVINPLFWILLSGILFFALKRNLENRKLNKQIFQYVIIAILVYIIVYLISGLFVTFGRNPYDTTLKGFFINLWIIGISLVGREYVRYKLINNVYDKDKMKIAILISIVYIVMDIEVLRIIGEPVVLITIIKYVAQNILPNIAKNILFSYTSIHGNLKSSILYQLITNAFFWITPILPNAPWVMTAFIDTVIPIILVLYIRYEKAKLSVARDRENISDVRPGNIIPLIIIIILAIWFAIGIFPIKPVAIASGSMEKELFVGDVAIIKKCNANSVNVGDIIEYQMKGYTVIHRIIEKKQKNGEFYFVTKGDNNASKDNKEVREDQLIGKVIFKIKYLGYPAVWFHILQTEEQMLEVNTGN